MADPLRNACFTSNTFQIWDSKAYTPVVSPPLKVCLSILGDAWAPSLTLKVVRFVRLRLVHVCEMWLRHAHVCVV